ncbi:MAG TPA: glycosyltransferase, partial [Methylomirabilota bacterium]|nr:glycosyltransferase [Methylomirabilota bacterium]
RTHCQSKIVYHGGITDQVNMRVFEAMGAGCLVVMRRPRDVNDPTTHFFRDREEVIFCDSDEEALAAIRYYARHEEARSRIAAAGRRKVMAQHNYSDVVRHLCDVIVPQLPAEFRSARRSRLDRFGKDARRERLDYAWYFVSFGGLEAAKVQIQAIPNFKEDGEALGLFGLLFAFAEQPERAIACLKQACAGDPQAVLPRVNLASVGIAFKRPEADQWCREALTALEATDSGTLPPTAFEGPYYHSTYDRFRIEVSHAYFRHPAGPGRNAALARLYRFRLNQMMGSLKLEQGRFQEALTCLERALAVIPDEGYVLYERARVHARLGDQQKMLEDLRGATETEPFFVQAQHDLAISLQECGRLDEAFAQFWDLLRHNPLLDAPGELWQRTGEVALRIGKRNEALFAFEQAVERNSGDTALREKLIELRNGASTTPSGPISRGMRHVPQPASPYFEFARPEVAALVPQDARRILDVGCGSGALGAALKQRDGVEVVGIESNPEAAELGQARLDRVIVADLDSVAEIPVPLQHFDCIVCADVLEHLLDPERVLSVLLRYLKPDGTLVMSIPNIRNEEILVDLLVNGRWRYQPAGILDATHLRFFTLQEIQELLGRLGLQAEGIQASVSKPSPALATLASTVERLGGDRGRFLQESRVIQYIFRARRSVAAQPVAVTAPKGEQAQVATRPPEGSSPFRQKRIALIYDSSTRSDTLGGHCQKALERLCRVEHFVPSQLQEIPTGFDLYLNIDDSLEYFLPSHLRPSAWWVIDTHLQYYWDLEKARKFDVVFCAQKDGAERLRQDGVQHVVWLPLACDPEVHTQHPVEKLNDVAFVGNLYPGPRLDLADLIREHFPNSFIGPAPSEEISRIYSQSRIIFNRSLKNDVNMRVFEALASGSLLVTNDLRDNGQADLFEDKVHLVTYRNPGELLARIHYYLAHEEERERVAASGRAEVLAKHTYAHRMRQLLERCFDPAPAQASVPVTRPKASVIVLAWNQLEYTRACVESVIRNTKISYELVLVDNGSTDGTLDYFRSIPGAKVVANGTNLGFAAGNNRGIQAAAGDYVVLLNNDTIVTPQWLDGLIACAEEDPSIGIVGPMSNCVSGPQQVADASYADLTALDDYTRVFRERHRGKRLPFDRIVGFCMMIRREVIDRIGLLDERFGIGNFEDDDYCLRAKQAGFRLVIAADVFIHHFGSRTFIGEGIDFKAAMLQGHKVFKDKWGPQSDNGRGCSTAELLEAGRQRLEEERAQEARDIFKAVLQSDAVNAEAWNELGCAEVLGGDPEAAEAAFKNAITLGLANVSAKANLASLYAARGRYMEAITLYEQVLSTEADLETLLDLAECYRQMGAEDSARVGYERVLQVAPGHPRAVAGLSMISDKG